MLATNWGELWEVVTSAHQVKGGFSPNQSAFNALIQLGDTQAEGLGLSGVEVVHDNQDEFGAAFLRWFSALKQASPLHIPFPSGNAIRWPLRHLSQLSFADSKATPCLRGADLLAGVFRAVVQDRLGAGTRRSERLIGPLRLLCRDRQLMGNSPFSIGPDSWKADTYSHLTGRTAP